MTDSSADCHVRSLFEGLFSTNTPKIFVTRYTTKNPTSSTKTMTMAEKIIQNPTAAVFLQRLAATPGISAKQTAIWRVKREPVDLPRVLEYVRK